MLRAVYFKNFFKFKDHQSIVFQDDSPFLFVGENGSGKSSVFEGIRRCLSKKLSTSVSSSFDKSCISYFICDFDLRSKEEDPEDRIISGYVVMPENSSNSPSSQEFYKTAWRYHGDSQSDTIHVNLMEISTTAAEETSIDLKIKYEVEKGESHKILEDVFTGKLQDPKFESELESVFSKPDNFKILSSTEETKEDCEAILKDLSANIVFTFPLRSIGPLQWSKSRGIDTKYRDQNYTEAEKRCEIIRYFLEEKNRKKFDKETEQKYFERITQSDDYNFVLKEGKLSLLKGKYELLKTPEGILEAKAFSVLMSSKKYKTIILEEPDKGMHPQFIERMLQIIKENKKEKRVLLSTHNKALITPWTVPYCFVFRREKEECYIISGKSIVSSSGKENNNMKRLRLLTADHISDILFARKVLFYEGDSEMLFLTELKKQVLADEVEIEGILKKGTDEYDRLQKNLTEFTLINMHNKDNLKFCKDICDKLKIAYSFLVDRDAVSRIITEEQSKDERLQEKDAAKARSADEWCRIRNELLKRKKIFFWIDGTIEDMVREMTTYDEDLGEGLQEQNYNPFGKLFLGDAIESTHVRESVKLIMKHCKPGNDLAEFIRHLQMI